MRTIHDITVPETKPATEWIRGRPVRKMSPTFWHAVLQGVFVRYLGEWARTRGKVGSEWRFRVSVAGGRSHPLVPDVAYMSFERLQTLSGEELQHPRIPPELVVEIRSHGDKQVNIDAKIRDYLAWGVSLVLNVDPGTRRMNAHACTGSIELDISGSYSSPLFPELILPLPAIFDELEIPQAGE